MKLIFSILMSLSCVGLHAEIVNNEAKGNLELTEKSAEYSLESVSNKLTPADLFARISRAIEGESYQVAGQLYLVAMAYGKFDTKRVSDKTAHQAISVLRLNHLGRLDEGRAEKFQLALNEVMKTMDEECKLLKKVGKPDYQPRYMIQHGMGAFVGGKTNDGLVQSFDAESEWNSVLNSYIKCP